MLKNALKLQELKNSLDSSEQDIRRNDIVLSGPIVAQLNASNEYPSPNKVAEMLENLINIPRSSAFHMDNVNYTYWKEKKIYFIEA